MQDLRPGHHTQAREAAIGINRRLKAGKTTEARDLLNRLPEAIRDYTIRIVADLQATPAPDPQEPAQPRKGHALPPLKPLRQTHDQQIAAYRAYRAQVSKSTHPILEEAKRRAACPHPTKVSYEDTPIGREAAQWHLNELRNIDGNYASVYFCDGCSHLHVSGGSR